MNYSVLYNPYAANSQGEAQAKRLESVYPEATLAYYDITKITDYKKFFEELETENDVILCGGDGTINRFVNAIEGLEITHKILYYPCGSGNDFAREVGKADGMPIDLAPYIQNLPTVTVKGETFRFLNGVGYGIDGYCCEVGDKFRAEKPGQDINYTAIAIKGLLFHYKPVDATVIVDGKEYNFKKVWLAPVMNGYYYGGGMWPAPEQRRESDTISVMLFHKMGKLGALMTFPGIFKGTHVKKKKHVAVLSGKEITVKYSSPRSVQVDGETILEVSEIYAKK